MQTYGTDQHKLRRNDDPETSHEAAAKVDTTRLEKLVHSIIHRYGRVGATAGDLLDDLPMLPYSSVTARFKALQDKGFISCGPDKRKGPSGRNQRVMRSLKDPE